MGLCERRNLSQTAGEQRQTDQSTHLPSPFRAVAFGDIEGTLFDSEWWSEDCEPVKDPNFR